VLAFGGSGNDETSLADPHPAELFDPETGTVETVDQELAGDVFCVGHAFLADGRLLAAGGTHRYDGSLTVPLGPDGLRLPPFRGLDHAYLFDPDDERWTRVGNLDAGRWYPTLVTLGDGSVLTAAGLTRFPPWVALRRLERFVPGRGWSIPRGIGRWLPLYPRLHLLPDGDVLYAGSYNTHYTFPFSLRQFPTARLDLTTGTWTDYGLPNEREREEGASVLLPLRPGDGYRARVLLAGGGTPTGTTAVADAEVIDVDAARPRWRSVEPMTHARYYTYAVLLPDGTVFVMGGRDGGHGDGGRGRGRGDGHRDDDHRGPDRGSRPDPGTDEVPPSPDAVLETELFDPTSETWTTLAPMTVDRLYHSGALLLPDGRVLTSGSNPARRVDELRIETYRPPYLLAGPRPRIDDAPAVVRHGEPFVIEVDDADGIDEVTVIRQSSTTHCLNTDQRLVELRIEGRGGGRIRTRLPSNPHLLPPGYYLLFVLRDGVPSRAPFVRVPRPDRP
jgi:hypothetical protein